MGKNRVIRIIKNFFTEVLNIYEKRKRIHKYNLETSIKVIYLIGSKSHKAEFKRYALFGKWMAENWRKIRIVDISIEGNY